MDYTNTIDSNNYKIMLQSSIQVSYLIKDFLVKIIKMNLNLIFLEISLQLNQILKV